MPSSNSDLSRPMKKAPTGAFFFSCLPFTSGASARKSLTGAAGSTAYDARMTQSFTRLAAVKAAAIMSLSTYATVILGLVVSALLARSLGPEDYGRYAYVLWLVALLMSLGNHGIPSTATRFISETLGAGHHDKAAVMHGWLQKMQRITLVLVSLVFIVSLPFLSPTGWEHEHALLAGICLICFLPKATYQFHTAVAKGHWAFWVEAWGNMIVSVIYTIGVAILHWMQSGLHANLWWFAIVCVFHVVLVRLLQNRAGIHPQSGTLDAPDLARIKHAMGWTALQSLITALSARTFEIYLLGRLIGLAEVGYYTIAANLARGGIELLSSSLSTLLMPTLARARGQGGYEQVRPLLSDANRYFFFLGVLMAGVGVMWAPPAIQLIYGARYEAIIPVLQLMVVLSGLALLDNPISSLLLIIDDQRIRTVRAVSSLVVSAAAALLLIPSHGLMGAVWSSAVNAVVIIGGFGYYAYRMIGFRPPWLAMGGIAASGLCAAAATQALLWIDNGAAMHWLAGCLYAVTMITMTVGMRVWSPKDANLLIALLKKKERVFSRLIARLEHWSMRHSSP